MARLFSGTSQFLTRGSAVLTGYPLTMSAWVNPTNFTSGPTVMGVTDGTANNRFLLSFTVGGAIQAVVSAAASGTAAAASANASTGVWSHVCGVFTNATSRTIYLNGGNTGTDATSKTPTGINQTIVGASLSASHLLVGSIAFAAIWNVSLASADVIALSSGASPVLVQPSALKSYIRMTGATSPEPDMCSLSTFALTGSPTESTNPLIYNP